MIKILNSKLVILLDIKIFGKDFAPNWSWKVFVISKVKNTVLWTCVISDPIDEEIVETFCEKELQKTNQKEFRVEIVIKVKGDKLYVERSIGKWGGHLKTTKRETRDYMILEL